MSAATQLNIASPISYASNDICDTLLKVISKILHKNIPACPPDRILGDPDFDPALLGRLTSDQKLPRLEGMLKGAQNFVASQEKRRNLHFSPSERAALFLKNLQGCLPALYAPKAEPKGPAARLPQPVEALAPIACLDAIACLPDAAFLDQIFLRGALCDLIEGRLDRLDPVTGDAACQLRAPFILDARAALLDFIRAENIDLAGLCRLVDDFRAANGLTGDSQIPPIPVLRRRWQPEEPRLNNIFRSALAYLQSRLGQGRNIDTTTALALAKALTMTQLSYVDPFGLPAIRHSLTLYMQGHDLDKRKVALSRIARDYVIDRTENPALLACLRASEACLSLGKGGRIPCLPMYPGLRAVLLHEQKQGRNLVVYLKRLAFRRGERGGIRHQLNGAEVFCFQPGPDGGYLRVDPPESQSPALCIDAWSMIDLDGTPPAGATSSLEQGLYAGDYATYREAFLRADILNLILAAAAAHPPLPAAGRSPSYPDGWADCGRAYAEGLMRQALSPVPSSPLAVDTLLGGRNRRESLHQEYMQFLDYLRARDQFDLIYSLPANPGSADKNMMIQRRAARNIPFTPIHIHASSFAAKQAECAALLASKKAGLDAPQDITFADTALPRPIRGFK